MEKQQYSGLSAETLTAQPSNAELFYYHRQGILFSDRKQYVKAVNTYAEALEVYPDDELIHSNKAQVHLYLQEYQCALNHIDIALKLNPKRLKNYLRAIKACHALKLKDTKILYFEKGLLHCPEHSYILTQYHNDDTDNDIDADLDDNSDSHDRDIVNLDIHKNVTAKTKNRKEFPTDGDTALPVFEQFLKEQKAKENKDFSKQAQKVEHKPWTAEDTAAMQEKVLSELQCMLSEGSEALLAGNPLKAMEKYRSALNIINTDIFVKNDFPATDRHRINYALTMAACEAHHYEELVCSVSRMTEIISNSKLKFPIAYYGLARVYCTLNRFNNAKEAAQKGVAVSKQGVILQHFWPGLHIVIPESQVPNFRASLKNIVYECKSVPRADAICRYPKCLTTYPHILPSLDIYLSDPDFKGYIEVKCEENCVIHFHVNCWKAWKDERMDVLKKTEKDFLGEPCLTPDCKVNDKKQSVIVCIKIINSSGTVKSQYPDTTQPVKQKKTKQLKRIDKKASKQTKHDQTEDQCESQDLILNTDDARKMSESDKSPTEKKTDCVKQCSQYYDVPNFGEEPSHLHDDNFTVIKRKDIETEEAKVKKNRKVKEKKSTGTLTLTQFLRTDVQENDKGDVFVAQSNSAQNIAGDKYISLEEYAKTSTFPSFSSLRSHTDSKVMQKTKENLYEFFFAILIEKGPVLIRELHTELLLDMIPSSLKEEVLQDGLVSFLLKCPYFIKVDDCICVPAHIDKACQMTLSHICAQESAIENVMSTIREGTIENTGSVSSATVPSSLADLDEFQIEDTDSYGAYNLSPNTSESSLSLPGLATTTPVEKTPLLIKSSGCQSETSSTKIETKTVQKHKTTSVQTDDFLRDLQNELDLKNKEMENLKSKMVKIENEITTTTTILSQKLADSEALVKILQQDNQLLRFRETELKRTVVDKAKLNDHVKRVNERELSLKAQNEQLQKNMRHYEENIERLVIENSEIEHLKVQRELALERAQRAEQQVLDAKTEGISKLYDNALTECEMTVNRIKKIVTCASDTVVPTKQQISENLHAWKHMQNVLTAEKNRFTDELALHKSKLSDKVALSHLPSVPYPTLPKRPENILDSIVDQFEVHLRRQRSTLNVVHNSGMPLFQQQIRTPTYPHFRGYQIPPPAPVQIPPPLTRALPPQLPVPNPQYAVHLSQQQTFQKGRSSREQHNGGPVCHAPSALQSPSAAQKPAESLENSRGNIIFPTFKSSDGQRKVAAANTETCTQSPAKMETLPPSSAASAIDTVNGKGDAPLKVRPVPLPAASMLDTPFGMLSPQKDLTKAKYKKVIQALHRRYSSKTREEVEELLRQVHAMCNGSLTGMKMDQIFEKADIVTRDSKKKPISIGSDAVNSKGSVWGGAKPSVSNWNGECEDCVICLEVMSRHKTELTHLQCKHTYHADCLRDWLKVNSSCPSCRVHTLLPDEYPSLS